MEPVAIISLASSAIMLVLRKFNVKPKCDFCAGFWIGLILYVVFYNTQKIQNILLFAFASGALTYFIITRLIIAYEDSFIK